MRKIKQITFLSLLFIVTVAFNFQHNPPSNWYQQFLSISGSQQINDITFIDSLTGFIITSRNLNPDTATIFKTTNGGDNWSVVYNQSNRRLSRIKFINSNTGFASGGTGTGTAHLYKTTNAGLNWLVQSTFGCSYWNDMSVLNEDTIWLVDQTSLCGGVFRTTNGGLNWAQQFSAGSNNPDKICMLNARTGLASQSNLFTGKLYRTTNSGVNWSLILNEGFYEMEFADSLTGWGAAGNKDTTLRKTTDGGLTWIMQRLPISGFVQNNITTEISIINKDTLWICGGWVRYPNNQYRGILYRTTNSGQNWMYQIPDTNINIASYDFINFAGSQHGWVYANYSPPRGIHTTNGGDTTWLTSVKQISSNIPEDFKLNQNYPNPFNPVTIINYELKITNYVTLKVYDLNGKEITTLHSGKQSAGSYSVEFNASNFSTGIYFYSIQTESFKETKKMILLK